MTKQELKSIVDFFRTLDYSTLIKALMVYEAIGTEHYYELKMEEMDENDLNYLEELKEQFEDYKSYAKRKESDINA